ncbi:MAG: PDDEXK nuclease domain-containing protein [Defluviitaleaceae bacterium]|nr:PDDEXK nuclease domain-containing protein [Defluviitaleaceae bacterium]
MEKYNFQIRVTGILIENKKILLVKQRIEQNRNWSLPGGRVDAGEQLEEAINRELLEETGLATRVERLLYICDKTDCRPPILHITFLLKRVGGEIIGDTHKLDLLFYNRVLKRLVAIDLKIGKFKPEYSGQMRFYLKWLERYEMMEGENPPIGIILCAGGSREKIELMELDKEGIAVAQYWTHLPPKLEFEQKIIQIYTQARERLERRKLITTNVQREIDYFYELKEEDAAIEDEE